MEEFADLLGVETRRSAQRILAKLVTAGAIAREDLPRGGRGSVTVIRLAKKGDQKGDQKGDKRATQKATEERQKGDMGGEGGADGRPVSSALLKIEKESCFDLRGKEDSARALLERATEERREKGDTTVALLEDVIRFLLRLVEGERKDVSPEKQSPTATTSPRTSPRKPRAARPLWSYGDNKDALDLGKRLRDFFAANLRPRDDLRAKLDDVRRYPFDDVARALSSAAIADGREFAKSPAAIFWHTLTHPEAKIQEGATVNPDSVAETLESDAAAKACKIAPREPLECEVEKPPAERFMRLATQQAAELGLALSYTALVKRARSLEAAEAAPKAGGSLAAVRDLVESPRPVVGMP